jgi:RHS repeat-associated protein
MNGQDSITANYTHGPGIDNPLMMNRAGKNYYYAKDGLGSVTALTDSTGNVVHEYKYSVYGEIVEENGDSVENPFTYTSRELDRETGLMYYRARYYESGLGRFLSEDPVGFKAGDVNFYRYVGNQPVVFVDPFGLYWFRQSWQQPGIVGRRGSIVEPGGLVSEIIENYVPAGYTFGEMHDAFVGTATSEGLPDWLVNIPSVYIDATVVELLRSLGILEQPKEPTPCN